MVEVELEPLVEPMGGLVGGDGFHPSDEVEDVAAPLQSPKQFQQFLDTLTLNWSGDVPWWIGHRPTNPSRLGIGRRLAKMP